MAYRRKVVLGAEAMLRAPAVRAFLPFPFDDASVDPDGVTVWGRAGEIAFTLPGEPGATQSMCRSADGERAFVGTWTGVDVVDFGTRRRTKLLVTDRSVARIDERAGVLLTADHRTVHRFQVKSKSELPALVVKEHVRACALAHNARRAIVADGYDVKLHDLGGRRPEVLASIDGYADACGFFRDGRFWAAGREVRTFDPDGAVRWSVAKRAVTAALSDDEALLAIALDGDVEVYAPPDTEPRHRLAGLAARTLAFDGGRLLVGLRAEGLEVYELAHERRIAPRETCHVGAVTALALEPERETMLFSFGDDGRVLLWDLESARLFEQLPRHRTRGVALEVARDGTKLTTLSADGEQRDWTLSTFTWTVVPPTLAAPELEPFNARRGKALATCVLDGARRVVARAERRSPRSMLELLDGDEVIETLPFEGGAPTSIAATRDGRLVCVGTARGDIVVLERST
ncbi:MAG: WD40 repeat domain-containing protein [Labilithrix sp.]|nr:WD40 repeat domain-containing protein [Labilithrix sp.]MCW5815096.1 WD40 repeat domain-containing protein [Labilithrix sp.]